MPWSYEVYKKQFQLLTVVGKKDDGQLTFHQKLSYSIPDVDKDKTYNVDLLSSDYIQVPESNKMFWFNPRVDVNVFVGGRVYGIANGLGRPDSFLSFGADVGLTTTSYGPSKVDSLFRLFRFGIGYNSERQSIHFSFAPITFNIGMPLPLFTNLYLTPQIAVDTAGGLTANMGVGVQF
jgi:hypothetical protein